MGVRNSHIYEMSESVGFPLMDGNFSIALVSAAVTSSDLCIVGEGGGSIL